MLSLGLVACGGSSEDTTGSAPETGGAVIVKPEQPAEAPSEVAAPAPPPAEIPPPVASDQPAPSDPGPGSAGACGTALGDFLAELDHLRKNVLIGVSYEQYVAELGTVRHSYRELPVDQLDLACLAGAAAIAEKSFDGYLAAANTWGNCISTAGCKTAALEPRLQRMWRTAARQLRRAQAAAEGSPPDDDPNSRT